MTPKSAVKVIFGSMTFGKPGIEMTRVHSLDDCGAILDTFRAHGHDTIDTARVYGQGSCEEYLGSLAPADRGLVVDTKLYPSARGNPVLQVGRTWTHSAQDVREGLLASLAALKAPRVHTFYLHAPDRQVDWEETLGAVDALHRKGYFERFGLSNFQSWEVARVCELCRQHGWIMPSVYQ
ncbi:MAG: aldo/keto reductase, partial [Terriglobus roseus]|nr:aldo/keto reductase [Terriglobus roseus]